MLCSLQDVTYTYLLMLLHYYTVAAYLTRVTQINEFELMSLNLFMATFLKLSL